MIVHLNNRTIKNRRGVPIDFVRAIQFIGNTGLFNSPKNRKEYILSRHFADEISKEEAIMIGEVFGLNLEGAFHDGDRYKGKA